MSIKLSERQETTAAAALTILATVIIIAASGALVWIVSRFLQTFSGVFLPLAVAAVAALVFQPYYEWLRRRLRLPKALAIAAVFLSILAPIVAFVWFFGALVSDQLGDLFARLPEWWKNVAAQIETRWPSVVAFFEKNPLGQQIRENAESSTGLMEGLQSFGIKALAAGAGVLRGFASLLGWVVLPVYFAFFLMADTDRLREIDDYLPFLKTETRRDVIYLIQEFIGIIVAFFRGQMIIAFLQGLLFAIGFQLVGLSYGFVLGLVLGFLNIIPYLGNIVGLGVALPLAFFQSDGGLSRVLWVLAIFALVQIIEGYLLTPKIMGDRTGLHPMAIIIAIFFWGTALNGISGMILAIPLTAFLVVFWRLAREKYVKELV